MEKKAAKKNYPVSFLIGEVEEGGFLAVSHSEPYFCLYSQTEKGAVNEALKAWDFFLKVTGKNGKPHVTDEKPFKLSKRHYKPSRLVSVAC